MHACNGNMCKWVSSSRTSIVRTMPDKPNEMRYASACSGPTCTQHTKEYNAVEIVKHNITVQ